MLTLELIKQLCLNKSGVACPVIDMNCYRFSLKITLSNKTRYECLCNYPKQS
jgi:hypothetical protein